MDGFLSSGNASCSSWPLCAPFEVRAYTCAHAESLDAPRFEEMTVRRDSRTVYDARHGANCNIQVGAWIRRWAHWGSRGAVLQQDNAPWLDMPFLRCIKNVLT